MRAYDIATELQAISPSAVTAYLRTQGWVYDGSFEGIESYWVHPDGRRHTTLPLRTVAGDFVLRMSELVELLAIVEDRTFENVTQDLQTAGMDVVSFRVQTGPRIDGSIALREGVKLFESARDVLTSAARSAVQTRPLFQGGAPGEVSRYLDRVRVGQTRQGSYVVNLLSPVVPKNSDEQTLDEQKLFSDLGFRNDLHFARSATTMLRRALKSAQEAVDQANSDPNYRAFVNAVHSGVSANLCEALVHIHESGIDRAMQINFRWAYTSLQESALRETFDFGAPSANILRGAATVLRATDPFENYLLRGEVIGLRRDELLGTGQATIRANVEEVARRVLVDLEGADYDLAVAAHRSGSFVSVRGRLVNKGTRWFFENPKDFSILSDDPKLHE